MNIMFGECQNQLWWYSVAKSVAKSAFREFEADRILSDVTIQVMLQLSVRYLQNVSNVEMKIQYTI
jgi:hypothetical protein